MMLSGCKPEREPRSYSYCLVREAHKINRTGGPLWVVDCIDNSVVVLPRVVHEGDQVFYDPYYLDDDTTTIYGYVHTVQEVIK